MASLRTEEGKKKYKEWLQEHAEDTNCALCDKEPIQKFEYWKIVDNAFPYDLIASEHHMLVPIRHVSEEELNDEEMKEIAAIKKDVVNTSYDWIIEATPKNKSIPGHFHLHLIVAKPREKVK